MIPTYRRFSAPYSTRSRMNAVHVASSTRAGSSASFSVFALPIFMGLDLHFIKHLKAVLLNIVSRNSATALVSLDTFARVAGAFGGGFRFLLA